MLDPGAPASRLLLLAGQVLRLAIVMVAFMGLALSGPSASEDPHDRETLVASVQHQPTGACHQSSQYCPAIIGAETLGGAAVTRTRGAWLRADNRALPAEFLGSLDPPPPRV